MKFIEEVSEDKLRGGFYTPCQLVSECYARLPELVGRKSLRILEPSACDGAFVRGYPAFMEEFNVPQPIFTCVELRLCAIRG